MMVNNRGSVLALLRWQWKYATFATIGGALAFLLHTVVELDYTTLPGLPLAVVGGAIGIFVSFRTNSAYDRWWEGRKLWGRMINTSRHICSQAVSYLSAPELRDERDQLVHRHIAYVHTLRCLLRKQDPFADEDVMRHLTDAEKEALPSQSNTTHALLQSQLDACTRLSDAGHIDTFRLQGFDESVRHLLDIQGGCERIKKTPMPRGYGFIAEKLIQAYALLFPFSLVDELGWVIIPLNVLICLSFALISEAGRVLEDPFTMFWNGLPLSAISVTIERNLLDRIGKPGPEGLVPDERGILM